MAYLNNIILVLFLFLNLFELFKPINCDCLQKNEIKCNNKDNKCCPSLNCKTKAAGGSFCRPYNCVNQGAQCDITKDWMYCCYGSFCSYNTKKCETCLKENDPCGYAGNTFKCCDGLKCRNFGGSAGYCAYY